MPLYRANVEVEICFWSEEEDVKMAHVLAEEYLREEINENGFFNSSVAAYPVRKKSDIPFDFRNALPWGREDDLTSEEVFDEENNEQD